MVEVYVGNKRSNSENDYTAIDLTRGDEAFYSLSQVLKECDGDSRIREIFDNSSSSNDSTSKYEQIYENWLPCAIERNSSFGEGPELILSTKTELSTTSTTVSVEKTTIDDNHHRKSEIFKNQNLLTNSDSKPHPALVASKGQSVKFFGENSSEKISKSDLLQQNLKLTKDYTTRKFKVLSFIVSCSVNQFDSSEIYEYFLVYIRHSSR